MLQKKDPSVLNLALLVALATAAQPSLYPGSTAIAASRTTAPMAAAQAASPPTFSLPTTVATGTTVQIDGSSSMATINQALKQRFETQFPGTVINLKYGGTPAALQAITDGKLDVAAIGRPLTAEEKAQGLVAVPVRREKIAIVVGSNNPFNNSLTIQQYAKIFRGEITDWSEVGGVPGAIRVVDRPEGSDTRQAFRDYPVFKSAEFKAGGTAKAMSDDSTGTVIPQLGTDGISYAIANQARETPGIRPLLMHKTLPDDPRYPFSQPLAYVYKGPNPSPAVAAFLGYATAPETQQAIQTAKADQAAIAAGSTAIVTSLNAVSSPVASPNATGAASPGSATIAASPEATVAPETAPATASSPGGTVAESRPATDTGIPTWLWWLLPLGLLGLFLWWLFSKRDAESESTSIPESAAPTPAPLPPTVDETADPASRAGSVINSDRAAINAGRTPDETVEPPVIVSQPTTGLGGISSEVAGALATGAVAAGLADDRDPSSQTSLTEDTPPALDAEISPPIAESVRSTLPVANSSDVNEELDQLEAIVNEGDSELATNDPAITLDSTEGEEDSELAIDDSPTVLDFTEGGIPGLPEAVVGGAALAAGVAASALLINDRSQSDVEAVKFDVGQTDLTSETLATVDQGLADLPEGYGESRIVLLPRDPQWAYAYWDVAIDHKMQLRQQGGQNLVLRLYDVTDIDLNEQSPHSLQQFDCDEMARDWYVSIPVSDRDYLVELGYLTADGRWLRLVQSEIVRIPPVYPSDWSEDQFATIAWDEDLRGKTFSELVPPEKRSDAVTTQPIHDRLFGVAAQGAETQRVAGSLFGSMQQVPQQAISSYVFPSGAGMWAVPTLSGIGMSGVGRLGIGLAASMPPIRSRRFWLVADAELIVYGATEPDAKVTIAGQPIKLNPDGTFRFRMSFQDGLIDYPILAVAADDEQTRSIQMKFTRETPHRNTNPKDAATDEWF